ncbi:MAG TPA: hypothetical protein VFU36_09110, partial [Jatrophihabitans sp.]|nr:hypothetical protein [Jatrophihabitans sp.]
MIEQLVRAAVSGRPTGSVQVVRDDCWLRVEPARPGPAQGWKLHVSATVPAAEAVLRAVLPTLVRDPVRFKVAASVEQLRRLNSNDAPLAQVGKFVTVYPADDEQAVRLAKALDDATAGLRGPAVPSDRPLRPGSLVHYRYGSFRPRYLQTPLGRLVPAIAAPDGTLEADLRACPYAAPAWARDPFGAPAAGSAPLLGGRYRVEALLHQAPRGAVELAVDTVTGHRRVLKSARRD